MSDVWWVRAGEVAALIESEPLTFAWDNGHSWGFRFRGKPVEWDHTANASIGGLENAFGEDIGAQIRAAIRECGGHGFEPNPLSTEDRALLDTASRALRGAAQISGRKLRADLGGWDLARFTRVRNRLRPRYLTEVEGPNGELYNPLIAGLLASAERDAAEAVILAGLRVLREKYAQNADVETYAPEEVLAAGSFAKSDRQWVTNVLVISGLAPNAPLGTLPGALGVPRDVETLKGCTNIPDFIRVTSEARNVVRVWPTAPLKLARGQAQPASRDPAVRSAAAGKPAQPQPNAGQLDEYVPKELLQRFEVLQHLGSGSYAAVYQVVDRDTLERFALKVTNNTPEAMERAAREADAGQKLAHPNILEVLELGPEGRWFLLPLAEGTLGQLQSWGRARPEDALELATAVGNALAHAHEASFLHRDLHPENVLRHDGRWKVADWGLAVARSHDRFTRTKSVGGATTWTAPEQLKSLKAADQRSDMFSLGRLVEWLASGKVPDPERPGELSDHPLSEFVRQATHLDRDKRPRTLKDALALLPAGVTLTSAAPRATSPTPSPPRTASKRIQTPGPDEFAEGLSDEDLTNVEELMNQLREWFDAKHETAEYNTVVPPANRFPARVWDEFVRRLREAGWEVEARGAMVIVQLPSRR